MAKPLARQAFVPFPELPIDCKHSVMFVYRSDSHLAAGVVTLAALAGISLLVMLLLPPVHQNENYHRFADQRTLLGIPNFWNVVSNLAFVIAAVVGARALSSAEAFIQPWERTAYGLFLAGVALTALGSGYYHLRPNTTTLLWDRLPMTIVFMTLLATVIAERLSMSAGRLLLYPLLACGALSVAYWKLSGDLRWYGLVQFVPMLALPVLLLGFPPRYSHAGGLWGCLGLYMLAKIAELLDKPIGRIVATGGHPWKHFAGAAAIVCYAISVANRRPIACQ